MRSEPTRCTCNELAKSRSKERRKGGGEEERRRGGASSRRIRRLCGTSRRCETSSRHERRGMGPVDRVRDSGYGLGRPSTTEAWMSSGTGTSRPSRRFSVSFPSFLPSSLSSPFLCFAKASVFTSLAVVRLHGRGRSDDSLVFERVA